MIDHAPPAPKDEIAEHINKLVAHFGSGQAVIDAVMQQRPAPPAHPETPQPVTAADVAAEFRKDEAEALDTAQRIEKRLALDMDFGNDRMLAAHYRKNAKHYGDRASAIEAALSRPETPKTSLEQAVTDFIEKAERYRIHSELLGGEAVSPISITIDMIAARDVLRALLYAGRPEPGEVCICAAVKFADGRIVRGHRHDSCFTTAFGWTPKPDGKDCIQGFITSRNRFVGREEGAALQNAAGILSAHTGQPINDMLFSEDLYLQSHDLAALNAAGPSEPPSPQETSR